jgi:hypothetical protein
MPPDECDAYPVKGVGSETESAAHAETPGLRRIPVAFLLSTALRPEFDEFDGLNTV